MTDWIQSASACFGRAPILVAATKLGGLPKKQLADWIQSAL